MCEMKAIFLAKDDIKIKSVYSSDIVKRHLSALGRIEYVTKEDILKGRDRFSEVKYIFSTWYMPTFTEEEVTELFPKLEALFYAAGTVKYFAEPFIKCGVHVFSAAAANAIPVAEFTASQIILANKGYYQAQLECKKPLFRLSYSKAQSVAFSKFGNYDACVGLIGAGAVGRKVVEYLKPYRLNIYVSDPYLSDEVAQDIGVQKVELEDLFKKCDVISNHLPDIVETKGMLNYELFSLMKDSATFINTGRGAQVDEKGLVRALKEKRNRCALLDVYSHEPLWPWSALNWTKNVFLTPHIAGSISNEEHRIAEYMCDAFNAYVNGKNSPMEIDLDSIRKMT